MEIKTRIEKIFADFSEVEKILNLVEKRNRLRDLETESLKPEFWQDQEKARRVMQETGDLKKEIADFEDLREEINILKSLSAEELEEEKIEKELGRIKKRLKNIKLILFLSGSYDRNNAIISIHAGQGGTEAMDWANMLYRMYLRFCEKKSYEIEVIDYSEGEEAGIKNVTFKVSGTYAYGYLKGEVGTHRLVRQSPFNADKLRHTSFALVGVLPELSEVDFPQVELKDEDLDWQFFRSSSQGGQNVQKVSTAVRVKHLPTGIVVTAQTQRFQEQNRKIALELLRAKLWALEQEKKERQVKEIKGEYKPASWGYQIRSYVLHPYKMIKDLRTQVETSNTEAVLDGEIDEFIEAELKVRDK